MDEQRDHDTTTPVPTSTAAGAVVCAVAATGSPAAVDAAALEADRAGAVLHLVHVSPFPDGPDSTRVLEDAEARARFAHPGLTVTRQALERSWVAAGVADVARDARYLVLERSHHSAWYRMLSGSTADGVAFKAPAPVLSVPHDWTSGAGTPQVVTAAVQDAAEVPAVVGLAAAEAAARGAELVVLHAMNRAYGHDLADTDARQDWTDRAHLQLDAPVAQAVAHHPDLKFRVELVIGSPADALVAASGSSMLVVAGRRHHDHGWGSHVGPVVHRVLLDARCPVLLVPDDSAIAMAAAEERRLHRRDPDQALQPGDVLVAVGEDDAGGAVRFAAAEARARGVGVHLVHVVRMPTVDGVALAEVWQDALVHGRRLLTQACEQARETGADLRVSHRLVEHGGLPQALVVEGEHAWAIVLQHRRLSRSRRLVTRSVTNGVAARTDVPVIAVPESWAATPEHVGCVVVGVQDEDDVARLVPVALEEAARRGLPVRVVHSTRHSSAEHAEMTSALDRVCDTHPDLRVHSVLKDEDPVLLLVAAMSYAELLVIGRRHGSRSHRSHLGPVARGVLEQSPYPVLLAP